MVSLISKIQPEYGIDFEHFVELQQSPLPLCIFYLWQIIQVIVTIIFPYYDIFRAKNDNDRQNEIPTIAYLSLLIFIPIGLHIYHWIHTHHPSLRVLSPSCSSSDLDINNLINQKEKTNHLHVYQIGNIFIVLLVLISSTMLLSISISSSMNHTTCHLLLCLEMTSSHSLQPYLVFQNVFHAIIPPVIIKAHSSWCAYLIFCISLISSFLSAIIVNESPHIYVALITFYILGGIVVYDNEITLHYLYENYMKHEENLVLRLHDNTEKQLLLLKEEELRYLFGNVAHDLKSPLHGFSLELETLSKHPVVSDNQQFMDSIIDLSNICSFMLMTINRALDYSKASTGMVLIPSLEKVNIKEILKWVIRCASPTTELPIKVEPFPESMSFNIETDRYWLMENLLCLVSNAQKFTSVGTIIIRCRLIEINEDTRDGSATSSGSPSEQQQTQQQQQIQPTQQQQQTQVDSQSKNNVTVVEKYSSGASTPTRSQFMLRMEVEDCGKGISPEERTIIFQPFKSSQRQLGGTGLGLYSLSKRMEALGGKCGVSERGDGRSGSLFWFSFPYVAADQERAPTKARVLKSNEMNVVNFDSIVQSEQHQESGSPPLSPPPSPPVLSNRVLVVDDSVLIQKTTSRALTSEGYVVDIARNGLECLEMVKEHDDYGFILMDIQMPVMDGIEATKRLRHMEQHQQGQHDDDGSVEKEELEKTEGMKMPSHHRHLIIGVSANADSVTPMLALAAGMDAFLSKPLSMKVLKETFLRLASSSPPLTHAPSPHPPVDVVS